MRTTTLRQLRHDFGSVLEWVEQGEAVGISKHGKIIALLSPPPAPTRAKAGKRPDFAGRLKRIYGNKVLTGNSVLEDRASRRY